MAGPSRSGHRYQDFRIAGNYNILGDYYAGSATLRERHQKNLSQFFQGTTDPRTDREEHLILKDHRVDGTCEWITSNQEFETWMAGNQPLLVLSGGPGKGKTFLSMYVAETLENGFRIKPDDAVETCLEFYCSDRHESRNTVVTMLRGFILNILNQKPALITYLLDAFERSGEAIAEVGRFSSLWTILKDMLSDQSLGRVYCILDGLDECGDQFKEEILRRFKSLVTEQQVQGKHRICIMISSRPLSRSQMAILRSAVHLQLDRDDENTAVLSAIDGDIQRLIDSKMDDFFPADVYSTSWRENLTKDLLEKSGGTFLWIGFAMEIIKGLTPSEIPKALQDLPDDLSRMYARILDQIIPSRRETAISVLRWVSAAVRPLSLLELHAAVAPDMSIAYLGTEEQQVEQEMRDWVSFCGHILVIDPSYRTVNFVHQSAKDYLFRNSRGNENDPFLFQEADVNFFVASRCISYLEMIPQEALSLYAEKSWGSREGVSRRYPLLQYSIEYWQDHATLSGDNVWDLNGSFFAKGSYLQILWLNYFESKSRRGAKMDKIDLNDSASLIHIVARLGIRSLLLSLLNQYSSRLRKEPSWREYLEQTTENGNTALHFAARYGHVEVVQTLLDYGADINARDSSMLTALLLAAWAKHEKVVDLLLNQHAEIGIPSNNRSDAFLDHKVVCGYSEVLKHLKSSRQDLSRRMKAKNSTIPLSAAVREGKMEVAKLLLDFGADIEKKNRIGNTPLAEAACNADHVLVKALLQRGAKVDARNNDGQTPLIASACLMPDLGRRDCINALLDHGADIDARDNNGDTALILATKVGYRTNVSHLIARGANTNVRDRLGQTPLMLPMSTDTESVAISQQRDVGVCLLDAETRKLDVGSLSTSKKQDLITKYSEFNNWERTHHLPLTTWPACIRPAENEDGGDSRLLPAVNSHLAQLSLDTYATPTNPSGTASRPGVRRKRKSKGSKGCITQ